MRRTALEGNILCPNCKGEAFYISLTARRIECSVCGTRFDLVARPMIVEIKTTETELSEPEIAEVGGEGPKPGKDA